MSQGRSNTLLIVLGVVFGIPVLMCAGCLVLGMAVTAVTPTPKVEPPKPLKQSVVSKPTDRQKEPQKRYALKEFIAADAIGFAYEDNALNAEKMFNGREIPVTGTIGNVNTDILGAPFVNLDVENVGAFAVQCHFPRSMADYLATLRKGQTVFIVGTCTGRTIGFVGLKDCRFVEPIQ